MKMTRSMSNPTAPTIMRMTPTVWMSIPLTDACTANVRIAPTAMSRMPIPMPMTEVPLQTDPAAGPTTMWSLAEGLYPALLDGQPSRSPDRAYVARSAYLAWRNRDDVRTARRATRRAAAAVGTHPVSTEAALVWIVPSTNRSPVMRTLPTA